MKKDLTLKQKHGIKKSINKIIIDLIKEEINGTEDLIMHESDKLIPNYKINCLEQAIKQIKEGVFNYE